MGCVIRRLALICIGYHLMEEMGTILAPLSAGLCLGGDGYNPSPCQLGYVLEEMGTTLTPLSARLCHGGDGYNPSLLVS